VSVDQPPSRPLVRAVVRNPSGTTLTRSADTPLADGYTRLEWVARDVPQVFPEPDMPPLSRCAQTLRLSTIPDWTTVSRWYWSICAPHLAKTTPAMTNCVMSLVKGCQDDSAKMRAVFKFVSQEIRYMGLTFEDDSPGYEPHDVDVTFDNRYGVCRDKAALLAALLRIAGIPAYPVLIHAGAKMDPEVPTFFFNHAIVAVERKGGGYDLMDPTDESTRDLFPSYLSNKSYLVARREGETLLTSPVPPVADNRISVAAKASLSPDGDILYSADVRYLGINDNVYRRSFLKRKPAERRLQLEGVLKRMSAGAELLSFDIEPADLRDTEKPLVVQLTAKLPARVLKCDTRDELHLPLLTRTHNLADMILSGSTALEIRRFPLALPTTCGADESLVLSLGDALGEPVSSLSPVSVTNVPGYSFSLDVNRDGRTLRVHRRLDVSAVEFDVPAYDDLRNARKEVETVERANPAFAKDANANANTRAILSRTVKHFVSPKHWVSTNTIEKEILTYRGKQTSAELKFSYAPCTRSLELLYATVSNKNGKVFKVTPKEINEVDCSWAASAPRYPASKQLVVNLPGVEIGSVLRYALAVAVTNSPVAYNAENVFDGVQPIDCVEVELHVPEGMPFKWRETDGSLGTSFSSRHSGTVHVWRSVNPRRIPDEPSLPSSELWRRTLFTSAAEWDSYGEEFSAALSAARAAGSSSARRAAQECAAAAATPSAKIAAVRSYLSRHVRVSGPGLFDLPFDRAFSAPDRALADGYASSADYMNLLFTMLEAVGFDCSFVLADNAPRCDARRLAIRREIPFPEWFDSLVVRAEIRDGGFPGVFGFFSFGGEKQVFHVGRENEYTPPEASSHADEHFFDPSKIAFGYIPPFASEWESLGDNRCLMTIRENGGVDFDVTNLLYGAGVGGFRKRFAEMLPEMRTRFYQQLVGSIAQNATATKELVTDTDSYPAETSFSAYVENFAVVQDEAMTVVLPDFTSAPFGVSGSTRTTPFSIGGKTPEIDSYEVVFPKGWRRVERLPDSFRFSDPSGRETDWELVQESSARVAEDGLLHVTVRRHARRARALLFAADYFPMFREWNRRAASPAARTIVVRHDAGGR